MLLAASLFSSALAEEPAKKDSPKAPSLKELKTLLRQAIQGGDESGFIEVLQRMAKVPGREPMRAVLDLALALPESEQSYYWFLLSGAASFRHSEAFTEMGDFVVAHREHPIAGDILHALSIHQAKSKYYLRVVRQVLKFCKLDLQLASIDLAAQIPVRRAVDILLPVYEQEDQKGELGKPTELEQRVILALQALTRQSLGDSLPNWQGWWKQNRAKGLAIIRAEAKDGDGVTGIARPVDPIREQQLFGLEKIPPGKVLVIKGQIARNGVDINFDHIEETLQRLSIQHDVVQKDRLAEKNFSLNKYQAIFINCTQINRFCQSPGHSGAEAVGNRLRRCTGPAPHDEAEYKMKGPELDKLKAWTEAGGHLFTEDWVLIEVLEPNWPKYVRAGTKLTDSKVKIRPSRGQTSHPLIRGVFVPPIKIESYEWDEGDDEDAAAELAKHYDPAQEDDAGDTEEQTGRTGVPETPDSPAEQTPTEDVEIALITHEWKIDNESPALNITSNSVTVLITSEDLKKQSGEGAVAVTFNVGKGKILHVLSHFGHQDSAKNEATLENLLLNWLLEVHVRMRAD